MPDSLPAPLPLSADRKPVLGSSAPLRLWRDVMPWVLVAVLAAVCAMVVLNRFGLGTLTEPLDRRGSTDAPEDRKGLRTSLSREGNLEVYGVVEPERPFPLLISAPTDGEVSEILVQPGDVVVPGVTVVARLRNEWLSLELERQTAAAALAQADVEAKLPTARKDEVARGQAAVKRAEERRAQLEKRIDATRDISPEAIARERLTELEGHKLVADAELEAAQAALARLTADIARDERVARIVWKQAQTERDALAARVARMEIKAPQVPGSDRLVVLKVWVTLGQIVKADGVSATPLVEFYDPRRLQVVAWVPAREVSRLRAAAFYFRGESPPIEEPRAATPSPTPAANANSRGNTSRPTPAPRSNTNNPVAGNAPTIRAPATNTNSPDNRSTPPPASGGVADTRPVFSSEALARIIAPPCRVRFSALKDPVEGMPVRYDPQADPDNDAVRLVVKLTNPPDTVRPGLQAIVEFRESKR